MKTRVFIAIAIRIIIQFLIGILFTYITPLMRGFFGDIYVGTHGKWSATIDIYYDWGIRHYWYFWMLVFLFLLSLINTIISIVKVVRRNYDTSKW